MPSRNDDDRRGIPYGSFRCAAIGEIFAHLALLETAGALVNACLIGGRS
jgi:hypothetical protein